MAINCPGSEWVLRMGPLTRTNQAGSRQQAVDGALRQVQEAVAQLLGRGRELLPPLVEGARCAGNCAEPQVQEDPADVSYVAYQLDDGKWFVVATAESFGFKLVCKG
jgi:hypothetical protein